MICRPQTARTCPEVSNKITYAIKLGLHYSSCQWEPRRGTKSVQCWCWMCQDTVASLCQSGVVNSSPITQHRHSETDTLSHCCDVWKLDFSLASHSLLIPHFHSAPADFKQPVAEPATSFNSGIPRSLEHHLIILLTIPATPTVPPFLHNGIWPE